MTRKIELMTLPSAPGELLLASCEGVLVALEFADREARLRAGLTRRFGAWEPVIGGRSATRDALRAYFDGDLHALDDVVVEAGGTPFQRDVWRVLRTIPPGSTWSYADLAERVGRGGAARAVGRANGSNPIALVVPCHRVVGSDGALTGYAGGLERKRWLLEHERAHARRAC